MRTHARNGCVSGGVMRTEIRAPVRIDSRSRNVIITRHVEGAVAEAAVVGALTDACGRGIP